MATKTKKAPSKKTAKAPKKSAPKKAAKSAVDATPAPDPCANGHKWDTDTDGEHCTVCLADRKVIEKEAKKKKGGKAPAKTAKGAKAKAPKASGKLSAIDAAAKVLGEREEPMNTKAMIEVMAKKGYWTSPGGATPWATLYSAILREIQVKGKDARFKKTERGMFAAT